MPQEIFQVDAFTDRAFSGNPAGVCVLHAPAEERWMQQVAAEMNVAETAFLVRRADGAFDLRWFTPTVEVDLCGHATLAAAHVLWETKQLALDEIARFETRSGTLTARRTNDQWIELDFPAVPAKLTDAPAALIESLGPAVHDRVRAVARSSFDFLVDLDIDQDQLAALQPDLRQLATVPARGVIVTTAKNVAPGFDFASRFFAPQSGIDEDPATGSAHCTLGPWWRDRLGKNPLVGYQASRRGGVVRVDVQNDRVLLAGQAVTVLRAMLMV